MTLTNARSFAVRGVPVVQSAFKDSMVRWELYLLCSLMELSTLRCKYSYREEGCVFLEARGVV